MTFVLAISLQIFVIPLQLIGRSILMTFFSLQAHMILILPLTTGLTGHMTLTLTFEYVVAIDLLSGMAQS